MRLGTSLLMLVLLSGGGATDAEAASNAEQPRATSRREDDEAEQRSLLFAARELLSAGKSADAIAKIDLAIAYFEAKYPASEKRWFVSRDSNESLAYMVMAASDMDKGRAGTPSNAQALLNSLWADAYYMKGYALVEQGRIKDAQVEFERAIALMPFNSQYLVELAYAYQGEKNWTKMLELSAAAEDAVTFSPKNQQLSDQGRAKRMAGYALVELGRLDEAAKKYEECLQLDPNDASAKRELDYVHEQIKQRR